MDSEQEELEFDADVRLQRHNEMCEREGAAGALLMGKVKRHALTGGIKMEYVSRFHDYEVVDLWTRPCLFGTINQFLNDKYAFRPLTLYYRTWIYHSFYLSGRVQTVISPGELDSTVDALLRETLEIRCIDAPVLAGRWSPIMCYLPLGFFASITADFLIIGAALCMTVFLYYLAMNMNQPDSYHVHRLATFPVRFGFFIWLMIQTANFQESASGAIGIVAYVFCILCVLADFIAGDGSAFLCYSLTCSYKVVRELPNRVFICQRDGAAWTTYGEDDIPVHEDITGLPKWHHDWVLIADIKGILVELRPMRKSDWSMQSNAYLNCHDPGVFYGLDIYDDDLPTARHIVHAAKIAAAQAGVQINGQPIMPILEAQTISLTGDPTPAVAGT